MEKVAPEDTMKIYQVMVALSPTLISTDYWQVEEWENSVNVQCWLETWWLGIKSYWFTSIADMTLPLLLNVPEQWSTNDITIIILL